MLNRRYSVKPEQYPAAADDEQEDTYEEVFCFPPSTQAHHVQPGKPAL
jgi:hypothetical protein